MREIPFTSLQFSAVRLSWLEWPDRGPSVPMAALGGEYSWRHGGCNVYHPLDVLSTRIMLSDLLLNVLTIIIGGYPRIYKHVGHLKGNITIFLQLAERHLSTKRCRRTLHQPFAVTVDAGRLQLAFLMSYMYMGLWVGDI